MSKDEGLSSRKERSINPCPFCAATWESGSLGVSYKGQPARGWNVCCTQCETVGPYVDGGDTTSIPLAIDLWNKAAPLSEQQRWKKITGLTEHLYTFYVPTETTHIAQRRKSDQSEVFYMELPPLPAERK